MVSSPYENENENAVLFTTIQENSRPMTPETVIETPLTPPRIRPPRRYPRIDPTERDTQDDILVKYVKVKMENDALNVRALRNINKIKELQNVTQTLWDRIKILENRLNNIQEILFENSEKIPNGLYVQLMDALIS